MRKTRGRASQRRVLDLIGKGSIWGSMLAAADFEKCLGLSRELSIQVSVLKPTDRLGRVDLAQALTKETPVQLKVPDSD